MCFYFLSPPSLKIKRPKGWASVIEYMPWMAEILSSYYKSKKKGLIKPINLSKSVNWWRRLISLWSLPLQHWLGLVGRQLPCCTSPIFVHPLPNPCKAHKVFLDAWQRHFPLYDSFHSVWVCLKARLEVFWWFGWLWVSVWVHPQWCPGATPGLGTMQHWE